MTREDVGLREPNWGLQRRGWECWDHLHGERRGRRLFFTWVSLGGVRGCLTLPSFGLRRFPRAGSDQHAGGARLTSLLDLRPVLPVGRGASGGSCSLRPLGFPGSHAGRSR